MARKNVFVCPICKAKNDDTKKYCDSCGTWLLSQTFPATKYNSPRKGGFLKTLGKVFGYTVAVIVLLFGLLLYIGYKNQDADTMASVSSSKAPAESEAQYKASSKALDYKTLARNPDQFKGKRVKLHGMVHQVQENGKHVGVQVNITKSEFGWKDSIYIYYDRPVKADRVLQDDTITIWGTVRGLKGFKTMIGGETSLPVVDAKYISIDTK